MSVSSYRIWGKPIGALQVISMPQVNLMKLTVSQDIGIGKVLQSLLQTDQAEGKKRHSHGLGRAFDRGRTYPLCNWRHCTSRCRVCVSPTHTVEKFTHEVSGSPVSYIAYPVMPQFSSFKKNMWNCIWRVINILLLILIRRIAVKNHPSLHLRL